MTGGTARPTATGRTLVTAMRTNVRLRRRGRPELGRAGRAQSPYGGQAGRPGSQDSAPSAKSAPLQLLGRDGGGAFAGEPAGGFAVAGACAWAGRRAGWVLGTMGSA